MDETSKTGQKKGWSKKELTNIINGKWIVEPSDDWCFWDLAITDFGCVGDGTLFIAIDEERWLKGSENIVYTDWTDTHTNLPAYQQKIVGAVVERKIEGLDPSIPQLLVENSYDVIKMLGSTARDGYCGKIIAITGTVGKSSTKMMLNHLLSGKGTVEATYKNHNSRTGVALTLTRCVSQPDFMVLEVALASLWMRTGGICKLARPNVSIITEIALGQTGRRVNTVHETARMKARIAQGIEPGGIAVLNRDMPEYDFIKSEVISYGATPISYGFHEESDFRIIEWFPTNDGSWITAKVCDQEIRYHLPAPGKGMASNSLAALSAVYALGINPSEFMDRFKTIHLNESVLESLTVELPKGGKVFILDDSYNAEVASMFSAFEVFKHNSLQHTGKKICILGRIVNLGDNAELIHRQLAIPLIESGADLVFAYGDEMRYLLEELPKKMIGGYYTDIETCAQEAASILEPDDYILLKGSRRSNDFGQIRSRLINAIKNRTKLEPFIPFTCIALPEYIYGLQAIDAETGEILLNEGNLHTQVDRGLGGLLLLTLLIKSIAFEKIKLEDYITISSLPARESKAISAIGFEEGERVSLYTLLCLFICRNSPDAALALAEGIFSRTSEALKVIKELSKNLGLSEHAVENITGRSTDKPQSFKLTDLNKVGQYLFTLPSKYIKLLNTTTVEYKGKLFNSTSNLVPSGKIFGGFMFGRNNGEGTTMAFINGRKVVISVCGARDNFHRDYLLTTAIDKLACTDEKLVPTLIRRPYQLPADKTAIVQFIGDTYFGEDYTTRRQKRGEEDALTKYGYNYSFEALKPFLAAGHLNIANFEGVLTDLTTSHMVGIKPFVLGGRIQESINSLKSNHIHAVTLGNNHAMDYGVHGLESTLNAFSDAEIQSLGAGLNGRDASEPLKIKIGERKIIIFSGYWYRQPAYEKFESYAMGKKPGVACLNSELIERIAQEKKRSDKSFIILVAHWGTDYAQVMTEQKNYAKTFLECGADLIIGSGPHLMQPIQQINDKWVIYSIGNGIFNSNGEYDQKKVPPYSFLVRLQINETGQIVIRLYPIYTNNLKTFWQPRFVTEEEFQEAITYQTQQGTPMNKFDIGMDAHGYYMEVKALHLKQI